MSTYPLFPDETKLASDRQLLVVLENISDAFIIFDTHWCYTYVNRAAETILQKKREDLLGKNVWEVYPEAVGTTVWTKYHEAVDTQTVVEFEDFYTPFLKWFHMRVYPSEEGLAVYFQDMTERKHAEEQEHFLAKVSKLLASTLDYQETLANIARLVVPQLADWFIVDLVNEHEQFELIEVDHRDPGKVQWAKELRKKYPVDPDAPTGAPNVARTGQAELYAEITDDMLIASARAGSHATAFSCASRRRIPVPCTRNRRRRPSGRHGCPWATFAHSASKSRLRARSLNRLSSTSTFSDPQEIRPGN